MTRVLGLLVATFIAYLLYHLSRVATRPDAENTVADAVALPPAAKPEPVEQSAAVESPVAAKKPVPAATVAAEKAVLLRNPVDGETVSAPGNYRFAKKWIKEALVAEGLLDKIYKNSELGDANALKVKAALEQFRQLEKYRA
ncbi:hypothetical protein F6R98_00835 [Candidatus Methylospira mobilis]|uniref:Uncharacterized protein n=1 Tax=Candidatus Methylospira mobilis TaxID=1808979 RepID=A0A5Q0BBL7_9GAMM|nr:hypothetical protein [Candidatus Methylospira mobilis]QFY41343.1 hypothetical protein F6R98_00835 [Candidatus Methylospira mobilis]WNV05429.1 hypothetical protein RP726_03205 [Candidatus Methylospira mobilis]